MPVEEQLQFDQGGLCNVGTAVSVWHWECDGVMETASVQLLHWDMQRCETKDLASFQSVYKQLEENHHRLLKEIWLYMYNMLPFSV